MRRISDQVCEIAPGITGINKVILDETLSVVDGEVVIRLATNNTAQGTGERTLGSLALGGGKPSDVVVEMSGISSRSGGELYELLSVHTPYGDHFVTDSNMPTLTLTTDGNTHIE